MCCVYSYIERGRWRWKQIVLSDVTTSLAVKILPSLSLRLDAAAITIRQLPTLGVARGWDRKYERKGRDFPILWEDILLATLLLLLEQPAQHQVNPPWIFISWNLLIYSVRREPYLLHTHRTSKPLSLSHSFILWNFLQQRSDRFLTSHLAFPFTRLYNNIASIQPYQWRFLAINDWSSGTLMIELHKHTLLDKCLSNNRIF